MIDLASSICAQKKKKKKHFFAIIFNAQILNLISLTFKKRISKKVTFSKKIFFGE
jgi:hypothetical protein